MTDASYFKLQLELMRAGAPNAELLCAKDVSALLQIAERNSITLIGHSAAPAAVVAAAPSFATPAGDAAFYDTSFDVRKYTAPPSYYMAASTPTSSALTRARAWRWTTASPDTVQTHACDPVGSSSSSSMNSRPGTGRHRVGSPPPGATGGTATGSPAASPHAHELASTYVT